MITVTRDVEVSSNDFRIRIKYSSHDLSYILSMEGDDTILSWAELVAIRDVCQAMIEQREFEEEGNN